MDAFSNADINTEWSGNEILDRWGLFLCNKSCFYQDGQLIELWWWKHSTKTWVSFVHVVECIDFLSPLAAFLFPSNSKYLLFFISKGSWRLAVSGKNHFQLKPPYADILRWKEENGYEFEEGGEGRVQAAVLFTSRKTLLLNHPCWCHWLLAQGSCDFGSSL